MSECGMAQVRTSAGSTMVRHPTRGELIVAEVLHDWGCSYDAYSELIDACFLDRALAANVLAEQIEVPNIGAAIEELRWS